MNNHLSQDQLSMWLIGNCTPAEQMHGQECPACKAEIARFQEPLSAFRTVMQDWSQQKSAPRLADAAAARPAYHTARPTLQWGAPAVIALLSIGFIAYQRDSSSPPLEPREIEASMEPTNADAVLMEAISIHLSRSLPAPMEPILALMPSDQLPEPSGGTNENE